MTQEEKDRSLVDAALKIVGPIYNLTSANNLGAEDLKQLADDLRAAFEMDQKS